MPSTLGIVASGEDVLNDAVFWVDAGRSSVSGGALTNLGTGGSALNAVFGNSTGVDTFDPQLLTHTGTNYLYLPGLANNYATVPDNAAYTPVTSLSYRFAIAMDDWTPSAIAYFGGHYDGALNQRSSLCAISTGGTPYMNLSTDGVAIALTPSASTSVPVSDGTLIALRYDWIASTSVTFYTKAITQSSSYSDCLTDTGWTQLGTAVTASIPATLFNAAAVMNVAGYPSSAAAVRHYATVVKIDGTLQIGVDFTTGITSGGQTTFTESSANAATVTINRATSGRKSVAVVRPILLFGTDDYLEVADNDLLDFGATDSFTVIVATRQWATITSQGANIAKKTSNGAAGTGWLIRNGIGTPADTLFDTYDGATNVSRTMPTSKTSGTLAVLAGVASASQLTAYYNTTASAATARQAGSYANSEVMRIGRLSGASTQYVDMEVVAAAVWRRALNANEIATIVNRYT